MHGLIRTRHLVTQAPTIVREFGGRVYLRCLWNLVCRRRCTFLEAIR